MGLSAQERAERSAASMWAEDAASQAMGMEIVRVFPGEAVLRLTVQPHHLNGHKSCHGGIIFSLADSAFAFACNSYNQLVVGQHCDISYMAPAAGGDVLTATALEVARAGRTGLYDVSVTNQDGAKIAFFRGQSRAVNGQHFEESDV